MSRTNLTKEQFQKRIVGYLTSHTFRSGYTWIQYKDQSEIFTWVRWLLEWFDSSEIRKQDPTALSEYWIGKSIIEIMTKNYAAFTSGKAPIQLDLPTTLQEVNILFFKKVKEFYND